VRKFDFRLAERGATAKTWPIYRSAFTFGVVMIMLTTKELRRRQRKNAIKSWPASANNCRRVIDSAH
jgi:hypothetical protein